MTSLAFWVPSSAGRTSAADPADDAGALARAASRDTGASPGREDRVIVYKMGGVAFSCGYIFKFLKP